MRFYLQIDLLIVSLAEDLIRECVRHINPNIRVLAFSMYHYVTIEVFNCAECIFRNPSDFIADHKRGYLKSFIKSALYEPSSESRVELYGLFN